MSKLDGLPKIYYINLDTANERNEYMLDMFKSHGITNFQRVEGVRYTKSGNRMLNAALFGCMIAHINAIKLVADGDDDYAMILEDDIDFSASDMWDFTWKEFMDKVPDFDILQLTRIQVNFTNKNELKKWHEDDRSAACYLITKSYAKRIIRLYNVNKQSLAGFHNLSATVGPASDHSLYYHGNAYSACIFRLKVVASQIESVPFAQEVVDKINNTNSLFNKKLTLDDII